MIKKIVFFVTLLFFSNSVNSFAKIQDYNIYKNVYEGCLKTISHQTFSSSQQTSYCGCTARTIMNEFTVKELTLVEKKMVNLTEDQGLKVLAANDKLWKITTNCVREILK
jgi:hypothetical protein